MHERAGSAAGYATAALWQKPPSSRGALALKVGTVKDMRTQLKDLMNFSQKKTHQSGYPQNVKALKNNQVTLHHDTVEGKLGDALIFSPSFRHRMSNIAILSFVLQNYRIRSGTISDFIVK